MGAGDEILAAGMAQKMFERDPSRKVLILDRYNRPRWHEIWDGNPAIATLVEGRARHKVQVLKNASGCRPYIVYPFTAKTGWTFNKSFRARDYVAKLYLTDREKGRGVRARARYGQYVLIEPWTRHVNFKWALQRWNELVEAFPDVTFVQHTHKDSRPVSRAKVEPATFREACGLLTGASAYVRSESGLCHASAALGIPTVTMWGGCMDADVLGGYPLRIDLVDRGPKSPCGSWEPCKHCASIMQSLTVDTVAEALRTALAMRKEAAA